MNTDTTAESIIIIRALRTQAWQRAKGELFSMQETFTGRIAAEPDQYEELTQAIGSFIDEVESNGLHE